MSKVKIGFSKLTVPQQVARGRLITSSMTGNASFPTPSPALAVVDGKIDELETAYNESRGRDKDKTAIMRLRRKEMLFLIVQLGAYVQQASDGDEEVILSSGFDVVAAGTPRPDTGGEVTGIDLTDGSQENTIKVEWDKATDAVLYLLETSATPDFSNGEFAGGTTRTQKEIGPFAPGSTVWIRIFAFGRENPGPHSIPQSFKLR